MIKKTLCIPYCCENCSRLVYIFKGEYVDNYSVLEFENGSWRTHSCFEHKGTEIWKSSDQIAELTWGSKSIDIDYSRLIKKSRQGNPTAGVIISLEGKNSQDGLIKILTVENSIVYLKQLETIDGISAGMLIDLRSARKTGHDKFRIQSVAQLETPKPKTETKVKVEEYLRVLMSAPDQEQLEGFINRFLKQLSKNKLFSHCIIPLEKGHSDSKNSFARMLLLPSAKNLQQTIDSMMIPESISLSVEVS